MALYAVDEDDLIFAGHAQPRKIYWCLDCFGPVKKRLGKDRTPHFYHIQPAPHCRLHSKTEDHLRAQLQLQKHFAPGALQIERPFIKINRVADVCWESEKVVFEIQCSPLTEKEAELRMNDYHNQGYDVVWLLDDKRYNKRVIRPAEEFLRRHSAYYVSIKAGLASDFYDQFEIFTEDKRVRKGKRLLLDLQKIRQRPKVEFKEALFPKQIIQLQCNKYFWGDRIDRALQAHRNFYTLHAMQNWRALEIQLSKEKRKQNHFLHLLKRYIGRPYVALFERLIRQVR